MTTTHRTTSRGATDCRGWLEERLKALVGTVKGRWPIERDYLELKQELGLGHYDAVSENT